jgi:hypothetical protein
MGVSEVWIITNFSVFRKALQMPLSGRFRKYNLIITDMKELIYFIILNLLIISINQVFGQQNDSISYVFLSNGETLTCKSLSRDSKGVLTYETVEGKRGKVKYPDFIGSLLNPNYDFIVEEDSFTGNKITKSEGASIGMDNSRKYVIHVTLRKVESKDEHLYYLFVRSSLDLGCAGAIDNYIIIKFGDGETTTLNQDISKVNCSGIRISTYRLDDKQVKLLAENQINGIRFAQSKSYADYDIFYQNYFINVLNKMD